MGGHVVSTDELPGSQALARAAPPKPARPGCPERREHAYIRHGTLSPIAIFNVATGEVVAPAPGPTGMAADSAAPIARTIATDPEGVWLFLTDHLNTHQPEALARLVAARCGSADERGVNGQAGVRQALAPRTAFPGGPTHRRPSLHTPKHTARLTRIGLWSSLLVRRVRTRGGVASLDARRDRILACRASFHQTAHPLRWIYRGRPLRR